MHGNNKSDAELGAAAAAGALVVVDSLEEVEPGPRGRRRGARSSASRPASRPTPTRRSAPATSARSSGSRPTTRSRRCARDPGLRGPARPHRLAAARRSTRRAWPSTGSPPSPPRARDELGWEAAHARPRRRPGRRRDAPTSPSSRSRSSSPDSLAELERVARAATGSRPLQLILEPGRSLTARAGVTLYTRRLGQALERLDHLRRRRRRHVRQPAARRSTAPATRPCSPIARTSRRPRAYTVVGKHCESGDLLIERVELPLPRRGDLLAVPATGAYTLAMSSTYNAVPRPAAVLVADGSGAPDPSPRDDRGPALTGGLTRTAPRPR